MKTFKKFMEDAMQTSAGGENALEKQAPVSKAAQRRIVSAVRLPQNFMTKEDVLKEDPVDQQIKRRQAAKQSKTLLNPEPSEPGYKPTFSNKNLKEESKNKETAEIRYGETGHLGFGKKGGAGFQGRVVHVDDDTGMIHLQSRYDSKKIYKGHVSKYTPGQFYY